MDLGRFEIVTDLNSVTFSVTSRGQVARPTQLDLPFLEEDVLHLLHQLPSPLHTPNYWFLVILTFHNPHTYHIHLHTNHIMSIAPMKCMFDTNVFNRILDGVISLESFAEVIVPYATHIQRDELQNTQDQRRREALLNVFHQVVTASAETTSFAPDTSRLDQAKLSGRSDEVDLTEGGLTQTLSAVWGTSKWGESMWSGNESLYPVLRAELDHKNAKPNNVQDALIADTAIRGGYVLVTDDTDLEQITRKYGGRCILVRELVRQHEGGNQPHATGI